MYKSESKSSQPKAGETKFGGQYIIRRGETIPLPQSENVELESGDIIKIPNKNEMT